MRTVRSVARARNRGSEGGGRAGGGSGARGRAGKAPFALVVLAVLALLAVLAARAAASPLAAVDESALDSADLDDDDDLETALAFDASRDMGASRTLFADARAGAARAPIDAPAGAARAPIDATAGVTTPAAPSAAAIVAAAYRAAGLADDPAPSWRVRTRLAGLVPSVTVRDGRDVAWRDVSDPTLAYVSVFSVGATWHLERLLFDPNELRISAIEAGRRRDRRRIAALVIRTYYRWLRLRSEEAAAELDALTDGWFSQNLPATPTPGHANTE